MYLSVHDSDRKRAFTLAGKHSLKGRNYASSIKKGVMDMLVLALLTQNDRYGYEIVSTISEYIEISEGTIYPLFNRLKKEKYVETYLRSLLQAHHGNTIISRTKAVQHITRCVKNGMIFLVLSICC